MTPAIAHDHKYFFSTLVTACGLHATTAREHTAALACRLSRPVGAEQVGSPFAIFPVMRTNRDHFSFASHHYGASARTGSEVPAG
jgi:hypothetical protein